MKFSEKRPVKIVMLGAGGTGGHIAPHLYRLLYALDRPVRFIICDGDVVDTDGKVSECRLGVTADERLTPETAMFRYPFSNVGGSMGTICIGRNALPQYKTPHALASLPALLLSIPNGDHSFNALNNKLGLQYRDLLEHLKDKDPAYYYSDVLIPSGKTLKDFIGG